MMNILFTKRNYTAFIFKFVFANSSFGTCVRFGYCTLYPLLTNAKLFLIILDDVLVICI
uniref:Uncharacterized protein n=1 Tax=Heterorhabditis bacteriophora TaxID=37862 RepID=A0A1I7WD40_HETBA